jgi:hypothetical protein
MINEIIGSEISRLSNNSLENEILTGEYLRGIEYAPKFLELINDLSYKPS